MPDFSVPIRKDFIAPGRDNRPGHPLKATYITIHETGNPSRGANAYAHSRYVKGDAAAWLKVSWHYTVDDKEIWQHLPLIETGIHARAGNSVSIGIELCVNSDGDFEKTIKNAQWLTAKVMSDLDIRIENVVQHNRWDGKNCPRIIRSRTNGWNDFIMGVMLFLQPTTMDEKVRDFQRRYDLPLGPITYNTMEKAVEVSDLMYYILKSGPALYDVKKKGDAQYVEIDPNDISFVDLSSAPERVVTLKNKYPNFINGPFFLTSPNRPIWTVIRDGKFLYNVQPHDYRLGAKGTMGIWQGKDGTRNVSVGTMYSIADPTMGRLVIQGANMDYRANGSNDIFESMAKESWAPDTWRECWRNALCWHPKYERLYAIRVYGRADVLIDAARDLGCYTMRDGYKRVIGLILDSGQRHAFVANGKIVGDGGGTMHYILTF